MNDMRRNYGGAVAGAEGAVIDEGLRAYMLRVYNYLGAGLAVSGILAFIVTTVPAVRDALFVQVPMLTQGGEISVYRPTSLGSLVSWSPALILLLNYFVPIGRTPKAAHILYWTIVVLIGASLGSIGLNYTGESIAQVFFITATAFGGLSLWGYTTKTDLSPVGAFLRFAVIGVFIAIVANGFIFASSLLQVGLSLVFLLLMGAAIAFNTQALKSIYLATNNEDLREVAAVNGALSLYVAIINMFTILMSLFGGRD